MTDNKQFMARFYKAIDAQSWSAMDDFVSPKVQVLSGGQTLDRQAWEGMGRMFYSAFPDGRHELADAICEGDRFAAKLVFTGTHKADFMGVPPTQKQIALHATVFTKIVGGKIVEHTIQMDAMGLMAQLGATK